MAISKHLLFSVLLLVGFLLASSDPAPPPSPPPQPLGFDYFMLALQWPNSVCFESYMCRPSVPEQQHFTIHGLWPQKNDVPPAQQPRNCDTEKKMTDVILDREKYKDDLLQYWPRLLNSDRLDKSKDFVKEQWNKHGSCSVNKFSPEAYLKITIALGKKYGPLILTKMEEAGIKPADRSTLHTAKKTLDAIKAATNTAALITCSKDKSGNLRLEEIRLCVETNGKTLQDCKSKYPQGNCNKDFIFPSPPTETHSRFPSFLSSMLDVEEAVGI